MSMRLAPRHALLRLALLMAAVLLLAVPSIASASPLRQEDIDLPPDFEQTEYASGFNRPSTMEFAPDGRLFVAERPGALRVVDEDGELLDEPFLEVDVTDQREGGLVGLALDPAFEENSYVYIFYTHTGSLGSRGFSRISRFTASEDDPNVAEPGSEVVIVEDIPNSDHHNGGALHFGPDGMLYFGVGDTTRRQSAQALDALTGKLHRIDVSELPYSIPDDNPFVDDPDALGEIWAYGLRNPFSFAIDPTNGRIIVNDVGENAWEEVTEIEKGGNHGWPECEGFVELGSDEPCSDDSVPPLYAYPHEETQPIAGCSVIGGDFYYGDQFPQEYTGSYFFSDFCGTWIARLTPDNEVELFADGSEQWTTSLRIGPDGALYYISFINEEVYRIAYTGEREVTPTPDATPTASATPDTSPTPGGTATPGATATSTPDDTPTATAVSPTPTDDSTATPVGTVSGAAGGGGSSGGTPTGTWAAFLGGAAVAGVGGYLLLGRMRRRPDFQVRGGSD